MCRRSLSFHEYRPGLRARRFLNITDKVRRKGRAAVKTPLRKITPFRDVRDGAA
jgi:hypothetical protein